MTIKYKRLEKLYQLLYNYNTNTRIGVINILNTSEKIKILMSRCGINQKELASRLGVTQPVLSKKFKLNNWRESDLQEIAQVCGAEYITLFKYNDELID